MFIIVQLGINVNTKIIHQVTRFSAIVIKIIMHEWVIFMQMDNIT